MPPRLLRRATTLAVVGLVGPWSAQALGQASSTLVVPLPVVSLNTERSFPGLWEPLEAGAVLVRAQDPAAIWYNPAGIVSLDRSAVAANAPGYEFTVFSGSGFSQPVSGSNFRGLPSFVGFVLGREIIPWRDVRIGFGLSNPISYQQGLSVNSESVPDMRTNYATQSQVQSFQASMAIAYAVLPNLRVGMSLGGSYDTLSASGQLSGESTTPAMYQGATSSMSVDGNTQQLVSSFGVQYRPIPWLGIGLVLRPPAVKVAGGSSITYNAIANTGEEQQLHFLGGGSFELRQPLQIDFGVTSHIGPVNFELNLFWHQPSGTYTLFDSSESLRLVTAMGGGANPVVTSIPFPAVRTQTRSIVNGSLGGNMRIGELWWLHGGGYLSQSPTYATDPFFQAVDYYGFRVGCSLREKKGFLGSIGLGYEVGTTARAVGIGSFPGTMPPATPGSVTIQTISILLALGYAF
jgi:hypothetical protein